MPLYSAAVVGRCVVRRVHGGGLTEVAIPSTTIPFGTVEAATDWVAANTSDEAKT